MINYYDCVDKRDVSTFNLTSFSFNMLDFLILALVDNIDLKWEYEGNEINRTVRLRCTAPSKYSSQCNPDFIEYVMAL